jgi:hypothetical protein
MLKKYIVITSIALAFLLGGLLVFNVLIPKTNISAENASLFYVYDDIEINEQLSLEESVLLKTMFNNKRLYPDNPSCGFTENVSIRFDDLVFCIACDGCEIIEFENKYFKISKSDRETVNRIFEKYGGLFPCI